MNAVICSGSCFSFLSCISVEEQIRHLSRESSSQLVNDQLEEEDRHKVQQSGNITDRRMDRLTGRLPNCNGHKLRSVTVLACSPNWHQISSSFCSSVQKSRTIDHRTTGSESATSPSRWVQKRHFLVIDYRLHLPPAVLRVEATSD